MNLLLINCFIDELGYFLFDDDNFESFIEQILFSVLFLIEDFKCFLESLDVVVILLELIKQFFQFILVVVFEDI